MQLEHRFTVPLGIEEAYTVLLDIERVVPCMPGAALDTIDGDDFTGSVKVKLGPIGLTYKGKARLVEKKITTHRVVLSAQGRDVRGNGTAVARVTATLSDQGSSTLVDVVTELDITGKPAQFGRGVMVEVGNKLLGQFADCLAVKLAAGAASATPVTPATPAAAATEAAAGVPPTPSAQPAAPSVSPRAADELEPVALLSAAGPAIAKRLLPLVAAIALLIILVRRKR
ncbi:MAG: coxG [Pseudonocardiales bacterium]|nr:coxG [Pseudonocardiales bacterium]